jgi:stage II sporulation protein D
MRNSRRESLKVEHNALIILICLFFSFPAMSQEKSIRVRIAKNLNKIVITGVDLEGDYQLLGQKKVYSGSKKLSFNCSGKIKRLKQNHNTLLATVNSLTGVLGWNKQRYRGSFSIIWPKNGSGCELINNVPLETYISSLLTKEMNAKWPAEALKAQAIAARTYAYHKMVSKQVSKSAGYETYYDLENSEKHQVNGSFSDTTESTAKAALATKGQVLTLKTGMITPIFFHSKCGGKTWVPGQVWKNNVKGYESVDCPFCHKHGRKQWSLKMKPNKLKNYLQNALSKYEGVLMEKKDPKRLTIVPDNKKRSDIRFYFNDRHLSLSKSRLRAVMGRKRLPSNNYTIAEINGSYHLKGTGYGHGVGLCQFGALELAKRGYTYNQILSHYFPKHKLEALYQ